MNHADLTTALETLGQLLDHQGESYDIVLIGGGALLLTGLIERPTRDLDIVARVEGTLWVEGEPMPAPLKLYAAVDQGPRSKHAMDLGKLRPDHDELLVAARWCRTHDPSEGFHEMLMQALASFGLDLPHV